MKITCDRLRSIRQLPMSLLARVRDLALRGQPSARDLRDLQRRGQESGRMDCLSPISRGRSFLPLRQRQHRQFSRGSGRAHPVRICHVLQMARVSRTGFGVSGLRQALLRGRLAGSPSSISTSFCFHRCRETLPAVLGRFRDCPALFMHSYHFGIVWTPPERPTMQTIDAYLRREAIPSCGKTVANPRWIRRDFEPPLLSDTGAGAIERPIRSAVSPIRWAQCRPVDVLRIHHYWSRSLADLEVKDCANRSSCKGDQC